MNCAAKILINELIKMTILGWLIFSTYSSFVFVRGGVLLLYN